MYANSSVVMQEVHTYVVTVVCTCTYIINSTGAIASL